MKQLSLIVFIGILPGWKLHRIQEQTISNSIGFKTDLLGEVLHNLRYRAGYEDYIKAYGRIIGTNDIRDQNAITRLAAGYLKLLFPDLKPSPAELLEYCLSSSSCVAPNSERIDSQ